MIRASDSSISGPRVFRLAVLAALSVLCFGLALYGAATMDLARDVFIATRILSGENYPLTGPILAGTLHLGPLWYYALAALLILVGNSWLGVTLAMSLIATLQIPLAYLTGKALLDRRAGLLWAALLAVPSWGTFNVLLPSHPQLAPPLMLAFLLCAVRFWQCAKRKYFFGMALSFVLALHAHPTCIALAWIGLAVCVRALRRGECRARDLAAAGAIVVLPLLPLLYWDALHGFGDLRAASAYVARSSLIGNLANGGPLFVATMLGGLRYWLQTMLDWPLLLTDIAMAAACAVGVLGGAGAVRLAIDASRRVSVFAAGLAATATFLTIAAMRDVTPFYMAAPAYLMVCGVWAIGLSGLGNAPAAVALRGSVVFAALAVAAIVDVGSARFQVHGAWPFGWWPLIDVKHDPSPTAPLLLLPSYAMAASGRFLCEQPAPSLHGVYASHVLMNYAIEMRLQCGRSDVRVGGGEPERQHWLGLSRALFAQLDIDPARRIGPIGLVPARPLAPGEAILQHAEPVYPAYSPPPASMQEYRTRVELEDGQYLVISDIVLLFAAGYEIDVRSDGRALAPKAKDSVSSVYACEGCTNLRGASLEVTLRSANIHALDVAIFQVNAASIR